MQRLLVTGAWVSALNHVWVVSSVTKCTLVSSVRNVTNYIVPEALFSCCATLLSLHICSNLHLECANSSSQGPRRLSALAPKPLCARVCSETRQQKQINKNEMAVFDPQQPLAFSSEHVISSRAGHLIMSSAGFFLFFSFPHPSLSRRPVQSIDRSMKVQILSRRRSSH